VENDQWLINGSPKGRALETSDFKRHTMLLPPLTEGEVLVKVEMLSFDPSQKGQMENVGYAAETEFGQVMNATGVGEVVESNVDRFPIGAKVMGSLGWQRYAVMAAQKLEVITGGCALGRALGAPRWHRPYRLFRFVSSRPTDAG
jgi:NADPH-dependent curcumin reductase CurA